MVKQVFIGVIGSLLLAGNLAAGQIMIEPGGWGFGVDPALRKGCLVVLDENDEDGLADSYERMSARAKRACLDLLLRSLTPEPGFTADEFRRALKLRPDGYYDLTGAGDALLDRLGHNVKVSGAIRELADRKLLTDARVLGPLVECVNHPLLWVVKDCRGALEQLTRHTYGEDVLSRSPLTLQEHQEVVAQWRSYLRATRHPLYDASLIVLATDSLRALITAVGKALPLSPGSRPYDSKPNTRDLDSFEWNEELVRSDSGRSAYLNWSADSVTRIAFILFRPGPSALENDPRYDHWLRDFHKVDYRERFDALDLEWRFAIGTSDDAVRKRVVAAVRNALANLRAANQQAAAAK